MLQGPALDQAPGNVGKYRVIAKLGEGGMAHVFLAVSHGPVGFSKLSVLKVVRPHLAEDPEILQMFLDEARLAGRLNHANVVQTYEVGEEGGQYVLVMEYLEGQPLRAIQKRMRMKGGTIPLPLQLKILVDALSGLNYAHELRDFDGTPLTLVHRDVSPHNIFVTYDGQVKVLDFGIAKAATSSQETKSGVIKGKISYMAPEQFQMGPVDRRADIYSMGAIIWQTATGYRLWKGANDAQVLYAVSHGEIPRPSDVKSGVPAELERICMRALAVDPNDRYPTASDMQRDLREYASELSTAVSALELGAFVAKEFAQERRDLRDRLEQQLTRSTAGSVSLMNLQNPLLTTNSSISHLGQPVPGPIPRHDMTPTTGSIPSYEGTLNTGSGPRFEMTPQTGSASLPYPAPPPTTDSTRSQFRAVSDAEQQKRSTRKGIIVAAVAGGLLALGAVGGFAAHLFAGETRNTQNDTLMHAAESTADKESTHAQPSASAVEEPAADAGVEQVELEIHASPPTATIHLDGRALANNPAVVRVPKDGKLHEVRIEASGYSSKKMEVAADQSRMLEVELKVDRARAGPSKSDATAPPTKTGNAPPAKTTEPKDPGLKTDNIDPWTQ